MLATGRTNQPLLGDPAKEENIAGYVHLRRIAPYLHSGHILSLLIHGQNRLAALNIRRAGDR